MTTITLLILSAHQLSSLIILTRQNAVLKDLLADESRHRFCVILETRRGSIFAGAAVDKG